MVPVVSLLGLWGFATVTTAQDVAHLREVQQTDARIREPVAAAVTALQDERRAALRQVSAPAAARAADLDERARSTDAAVSRLRLGDRHTLADAGDTPPQVAERVRAFVERAQRLKHLRAQARNHTPTTSDGTWDAVYEGYTAAITAAFAVDGALAGIQDATTGAHARVLLEFAHAWEMLAREDALLTSAHLTGRLTAPHQRLFTGTAEARRTLAASAAADLPEASRTAWRRLTAQSAYREITDAEKRIAAAPAGRAAATAVPAARWDPAHTAVRTASASLEAEARHAAAATAADPLADGVLTPAGAAVLLGLAAVAASLVISVRIGRALVVELVSLRNTALDIARRKLPHAMSRLRAGEELDIHAEAPPGPPAQDEIGQVGEALGTVHRAALGAAVERAELASGISGVFVNLARRSQVLVHRQLNLLDSMERRAEDPNELGDLFRLDHLTTRMRRHAESLIILSGAAPGRAWRTPVPLTNVVRAAVSEIEDYARVEVRRLPETAVTGGAVADLTHLLAELIENATQFSPPHTKVRVTGEPVGNGYALEIEDRGLGMGKEALADANRRIAQSETLDLFDSDRLGLFVVSRLSARHDIKVHLRPSPYGGTTAVVLLPIDVLQSALPAGSGTRHATPHPPEPAGAPHSGFPDHGAAAPAVASLSADTPWTPTPHPGPPVSEATHASPRPEGASESSPAPTTVTALRPHHQRATQHTSVRDPAPAGDGADSGLPRRTRQASLAPQLRGAAPAQPDDADDGPAADERAERRTPEQVRARMTAYRDGWVRGGGTAPGTRTSTHGSEGDQG
ncbi:nitrate- and nitrite sensing domain-containing protein [Streptomyces coeruleoprunus]